MAQDRLHLALAILAVDAAAVGGLWLQARAGPARALVEASIATLPAAVPLHRISPAIDDQALFGGLDSVASMAAGRVVHSKGLLDRPAILVLPMAERCPSGLAARLGQALDSQRVALVALDESAEPDEALPSGLADRLGLFVSLEGCHAHALDGPALDPTRIAAARQLLPRVKLADGAIETLLAASQDLGVSSPRANLLTLAAARCIAALEGRTEAGLPDVTQAAALCLAHRASAGAESPAPPDPSPPDAQAESEADGSDKDRPTALPEDILVNAVRAALPDDVLRALAAGRAARGPGGGRGSGAVRVGNRRGAPLPSRPGRPSTGARLDLIATLRAAAPWQRVRRQQAGGHAHPALMLERGDLRIRRSREMSDRVLIFAVDASGSAAMSRLAEAKGAVEILLAQAYSRRDHVALLAFRKSGAELLLPPTRSLVNTKNRLRGLAGGGATPLASGLNLALETALRARSRGQTPTIALLTDGRANIALDGTADRPRADADAQCMARAIRGGAVPSILIDVAQRPQPALAELARQMAARYIALPRMNSGQLAGVLGAALEA